MQFRTIVYLLLPCVAIVPSGSQDSSAHSGGEYSASATSLRPVPVAQNTQQNPWAITSAWIEETPAGMAMTVRFDVSAADVNDVFFDKLWPSSGDKDFIELDWELWKETGILDTPVESGTLKIDLILHDNDLVELQSLDLDPLLSKTGLNSPFDVAFSLI